jgi:hypothetical protein
VLSFLFFQNHFRQRFAVSAPLNEAFFCPQIYRTFVAARVACQIFAFGKNNKTVRVRVRVPAIFAPIGNFRGKARSVTTFGQRASESESRRLARPSRTPENRVVVVEINLRRNVCERRGFQIRGVIDKRPYRFARFEIGFRADKIGDGLRFGILINCELL